MLLGQVMRNLARVIQNFAVVQFQETIKLSQPLSHGHWNTTHGLAFRKHQVLLDQIVQSAKFFCREVVFSIRDILFANLGTALVGQAHVGFTTVRTIVNKLGRSLPGNCPVHFVL